ALGYAVPAALGAAFAEQEAPILAFTGDGGLGFNCGELETIARTNQNVSIILFRNNTFGWIRGETVLVNESEPFCTDFSKNTDYLAVAAAFGMHCQKLTDHNNIRPVLEEALGHRGPSFIEVEVVSQDIIAPFVPKWVSSAKKKKLPYLY
ncbi:MAG: thiamine pyrophosphate-binding protein, partial [Desulfobacterales bacterium]|nr:thiamine pyrophosphate-binding protein [Desulfobacterales bacterium]